MKIRPATDQDIDDVLRLVRAVATVRGLCHIGQAAGLVVGEDHLAHGGDAGVVEEHVPAPKDFGVALIGVQEGSSMELDLRFEAVHEGILVSGTVDITYSNNSPDTLKQVWFKLYPNLYKAGTPRASARFATAAVSSSPIASFRPSSPRRRRSASRLLWS
mgnify:CR=1 FL=1